VAAYVEKYLLHVSIIQIWHCTLFQCYFLISLFEWCENS